MGIWTRKQTESLQLRDLLPKALPDVRIMTYGYNAAFLNLSAEQDIRSISAKLSSELVDLRRDEKVRFERFNTITSISPAGPGPLICFQGEAKTCRVCLPLFRRFVAKRFRHLIG